MNRILHHFLPSMKLFKTSVFAVFFMFGTMLNAQDTIYTTAGTVTACPGELVTIPILVEDCNDVASISLILGFDPTVLIYQGWQNLNPVLASGMLLVNSVGSQVALSWFHFFQSANVGTDTLIEYMFTYLGGTSQLNWDTATSGNTQYGRLNGSLIPALFFDGTVSLLGLPAIITTQPLNTTIFANTNASFSVAALNTTTFQWQECGNNGFSLAAVVDGGIYSGATTNQLELTGVPVGMNGYRYRC
ncbi:MAG: hypothetical protein K8S00_04705, partial [Bacteroidales bacterium]|nr:hypothetical protein [Bacteroidales bacterium]